MQERARETKCQRLKYFGAFCHGISFFVIFLLVVCIYVSSVRMGHTEVYKIPILLQVSFGGARSVMSDSESERQPEAVKPHCRS